MKLILFLACVLFFTAARQCQAQPVVGLAFHIVTFERPSTTFTNVQLHLYSDKTCIIVGPAGVPPQNGTWDEKRLVRTFWIMNSSNQYVGTIRRGVIRGTFLNYRTGETGTLEAEPR